MAEKVVTVCDLCATEGHTRMAKYRYFSPEANKWFDACYTHAQEAKKWGFELIKEVEG